MSNRLPQRSHSTDSLSKESSSSCSTNTEPLFTPFSTDAPGTPYIVTNVPQTLDLTIDPASVARMDAAHQSEKPADDVQLGDRESEMQHTDSKSHEDKSTINNQNAKTESKNIKHRSRSSKAPVKKSKKTVETDDSDEDTSDTSNSSSESSSDEEAKKSSRRKKKALKKKKKQQKSKSKKDRDDSDSSSESDESDDDTDATSSSSEEEVKSRRRGGRKGKKSRRHVEDSDEDGGSFDEDEEADADEYARLQAELSELNTRAYNRRLRGLGGRGGKSRTKRKPGKRASMLEFKRVDQLWDNSIHNYKLTESAKEGRDEFSQYIFTVRRKFDWENKYKNTVVDIKSKLLREALQEIMKDVKGVSLVEDAPSIDPNMLFLYLDELRALVKTTLKARAKAEKKRKLKKRVKLMISHCKVLIKYLDEDYAETIKALYPMLEEGTITFDLLWAIFKPNSVAFTTTYGSVDDPRCFKVDSATKESSFMRGEWYSIEGKYLEYDGKAFGLGEFDSDVESFRGARKITSLSTYPLKYHKDSEGIKAQLVERGKHFISLQGMNYRFHKGLAFMKKKRAIAKVNINGRIMIDPAIFRRVNPNYLISLVKANDPDEENGGESDDDSDCCKSKDSDDDGNARPTDYTERAEAESTPKTKWKVVLDKDKNYQVVKVDLDERGLEIHTEKIEKFTTEGEEQNQVSRREFTDEELLIASPVVLGFAFSEKLWLEFSLSGVRDIEWNEGAFESLVLPPNQKTIVKALVESHKFHAAKTIDDVVQGKGKGLVAVLHGPPGTGKTLTAEGIAELLKCPLYMVSAGELGTDPRVLEHELQKILDIAHSWGAVLLLDEADVFLEKRELHDIHRNALVSIFLRILEYFQGILFLTTNRVQTFDDAFQSRIHIALRYGELTTRAKKSVWKMFLEKVNAMEGEDTISWTDADYNVLAKYQLNGRQIKNAVRTAQALAVNEGVSLNMEHLKRVLQVAEAFEQDLKGGSGYDDAMRSYT